LADWFFFECSNAGIDLAGVCFDGFLSYLRVSRSRPRDLPEAGMMHLDAVMGVSGAPFGSPILRTYLTECAVP